MPEPNMRTESGVSVLDLKGRLNLGTNLTFLELDLKNQIDAGVRQLVIDMSALDYIDSAGIGALMSLYGYIEKAGGRMAIAGANGVVADSFQIVHLDRVIDLFPDLAGALGSFAS